LRQSAFSSSFLAQIWQWGSWDDPHDGDRIPALPVVLHTFPSDYGNNLGSLNKAVFVEKVGNSIERLKEVISEMARMSNAKEPQASKAEQTNAKKSS